MTKWVVVVDGKDASDASWTPFLSFPLLCLLGWIYGWMDGFVYVDFVYL
jgi:hypothetical protein